VGAERFKLASLAVAGCVGLLLQVTQSEDPRPPLAYYSVLSALAVTIGVPLLLVRVPGSRIMMFASSTAVLVSALVFWALIAPSNGMGNTGAAIGATLVLHLALPGLVVLCAPLLRSPLTNSRMSAILASLTPPLVYLVGLIGFGLAHQPPPYDFLRPAQVGWLAVLGASVGIAALHCVTGWILARGAPTPLG
jgi:hypothetical protein